MTISGMSCLMSSKWGHEDKLTTVKMTLTVKDTASVQNEHLRQNIPKCLKWEVMQTVLFTASCHFDNLPFREPIRVCFFVSVLTSACAPS